MGAGKGAEKRQKRDSMQKTASSALEDGQSAQCNSQSDISPSAVVQCVRQWLSSPRATVYFVPCASPSDQVFPDFEGICELIGVQYGEQFKKTEEIKEEKQDGSDKKKSEGTDHINVSLQHSVE